MPNVHDCLPGLRAHGLHVVPLKAGEKKLLRGGKMAEQGWRGDESPVCNVGVLLGELSGNLVDVDLDMREARELVDLVFGRRIVAFGRAGAITHLFIRHAGGAPKQAVFEFSDRAAAQALLGLEAGSDDKCRVVELRASAGQYTMVPPSLHPHGDQLAWLPDRAPGDGVLADVWDWDEIHAKGRLLAFLAVVLRRWPRQEGSGRHDLTLALAGALVRFGVEPETADDWVAALRTAAGDTKRREARQAASMRAKIDAGEEVTGLPTLMRGLGLEPLLADVQGWFRVGADTDDGAPADAIRVDNPNIDELDREVEAALVARSGKVWRMYSGLARVAVLEAPQRDDATGNVCHPGLIELRPASPTWLMREASAAGVRFAKAKGKGVGEVSPPGEIMARLCAVADLTAFPLVRALSLTPTLGRDEPGYDAESKLLLAFAPGTFPPVPMRPTRDDAVAALARLAHPIRSFPYVAPADRAVALSALLSSVARPELATCPLHGFDAPAAGTGKTKLANLGGILATGVRPSGISLSCDEEENTKRLVGMLRTGDPVVLIDNIQVDVSGAFLCMMLTQETVKARVLGSSDMPEFSTRTMVLATGNNLTLAGDMGRRAVVCRLDAKRENPEEREFDFDPEREVEANRAALVADALTVLRAYRAAGEPGRGELEPFGSFADWELVRGALVWLGEPDPVATRSRVKSANPIVEERGELFRAIAERFPPTDGGGAWFTTREAGERGDHLTRVLTEQSGGRDWSSKGAGKALSRHRDIPLMGVVLRSRVGGGGITRWRLELDGATWVAVRERLFGECQGEAAHA